MHETKEKRRALRKAVKKPKLPSSSSECVDPSARNCHRRGESVARLEKHREVRICGRSGKNQWIDLHWT